ncbi:MAG: hybrid sensor histidine kinase/response regulator [Caldilineaceae bacterium]|nr:hybrid sensor histidine kinase/response regulator [Caldilineaceae bacterium]MBP9072299.1 hybrid sensor histidine kinase/response regulator [Caldilineaceae bacterium]
MNPLLLADGTIEDEELRAIFHSESEEHLHGLDEGLLFLETNLTHAATLQELFRHAHNLKGTARMLGLEDLGSIAHHFEDVLGAAQRGERVLAPPEISHLSHYIDPMRQLALHAVNGSVAQVDVDDVLRQLQGTTEQETPPTQPTIIPPDPPTQTVQPVFEPPVAAPIMAPPPQPVANPTAQPAPVRSQLDTIRVTSQKLDALMTQIGELVVTNIRLSRRMAEMDEMVAAFEEWGRAEKSTTPRASQDLEADNPLAQGIAEMGQRMTTTRNRVYEDVTRLNQVVDGLEETVRSVRLVPAATLFGQFSRMVRELARDLGKVVDLVVEGGETEVDKRVVEELKDPLMHMLRNAVDHGIELPAQREGLGKAATAKVTLRAYQTASAVVIEVCDDGRGLDLEAIRRTALRARLFTQEQLDAMTEEQLHQLIFRPGFSTNSIVTDVSGRGVGMDVVHTNVVNLKGDIKVFATPDLGTTVRITVPLSLASVHSLILRTGGHMYALPIDRVEALYEVRPVDIFEIAGQPAARLGEKTVSLARLTDLLELPLLPKAKGESEANHPCVVLDIEGNRLGLLVDELIDEQEVVLKPLNGLLHRVRNVSGATILGDGAVCIVLNPWDLVRSALSRTGPTRSLAQAPAAVEIQPPQSYRVLLAEDSITTRIQERRILEQAGYTVTVAVDGMDAWEKFMSAGPFHALISDVEMPRLDGFGLAARVRQDKKWQELPIILVTSLVSDADKKRGIDVGANAYIVKSTFDQKVLLDTLRRLV